MSEVAVPADLLADFIEAVNTLLISSSLSTQATAVEEVENLRAQIITWHPDYDYNTGELRQ